MHRGRERREHRGSVVVVVTGTVLALGGFTSRLPGGLRGPLTQTGYELAVKRACAVTKPDLDAAINAPATPSTTNDQLTLLIDQARRTTTFDPDVVARQKEPVLAAMTRAGSAFTALHLDDTGCVVL